MNAVLAPQRIQVAPAPAPAPATLASAVRADEPSRLESMLHQLLGASQEIYQQLRYREPLPIKVGLETQFLRPADIVWIEAQSDYMLIHTLERKHLARLTLKALLERLPRTRFVRVHKSTVVNLDYVSTLRSLRTTERRAVLTNGTQLRVSESGYKALLDAMSVAPP